MDHWYRGVLYNPRPEPPPPGGTAPPPTCGMEPPSPGCSKKSVAGEGSSGSGSAAAHPDGEPPPFCPRVILNLCLGAVCRKVEIGEREARRGRL
jgi:hypothetical protein